VNPSFTSASFGLARCHVALADPIRAVAAYERVLETSSAHVDAQVAEAQLLLDASFPDRIGGLQRAERIVKQLPTEREQRDVLSARVLETAMTAVDDGASPADPTLTVLGRSFDERDLRVGLEEAYRKLARRATTRPERVALVEYANHVRPRSVL